MSEVLLSTSQAVTAPYICPCSLANNSRDPRFDQNLTSTARVPRRARGFPANHPPSSSADVFCAGLSSALLRGAPWQLPTSGVATHWDLWLPSSHRNFELCSHLLRQSRTGSFSEPRPETYLLPAPSLPIPYLKLQYTISEACPLYPGQPCRSPP